MMRKLSLVLLITFAVGWAWLGGLRIALGHAEYERSEPAADDVVDPAPTQVRIWFTQEIFRRQGENRIEVVSADGTRVDRDDVAIDDDDRKLMTVSLDPALGAGLYTVRWHALSSEDGHAGDGEFTFTVAGAAATGLTETVALTNVTGVLTTTNPLSDTTAQPEATPTSAPPPATLAPTATPLPDPTATPPAPTSGLPCLGGAAPLALALGAVVVRRRRL